MNGVTAKVRFLSKKEGGRSTLIRSGYRPAFWFRATQGNDGVLELLDREEAMPGEECDVRITFLHPEYLKGLAEPGTAFEVKEGGWVVAKGIVLKALGSSSP